MNRSQDGMNHSIRKKLESLRQVPERRVENVQKGRAKFLADARSAARTVSKTSISRHKGWFEKFTIRKERYAMIKILTIILIAISTALAGTGAVAAASQNSLPDQTLYPVKIWTEDLRMGMAESSPADALDLALEFAARRVNEISRLTGKGVGSPDSVRMRLELEIYQAYQASTRLQGEALAQALLRIESALRTQEETMLRLHTNAQTEPECARTRDMLRQHLRLFEENQGDATMLESQIRLRLQQHKPVDTGSPQSSGQNGLQLQGTPEPGVECPGSGNMYSLTGTPSGGYGNGNMYSLTGTPSGEYGNGNLYCLTQTPSAGNGTGPGDGQGGKR